MKIFFKVVLIERGRDIPMQMVSVGLVREDGHEFYAINEECLSNVSREPYLAMNAMPMLPIHRDQDHGYQRILEWDREQIDYPRVMALDRLANNAREFIAEVKNPELWAWHGAFDYVCLVQLFGKRAEIPAGIPQGYYELVQYWDSRGRPDLPSPLADIHALKEAAWVRDAYVWMTDPEALVQREQAVGFIGHPDAGKTELVRGVQEQTAVPYKLGDLPPDGAVIDFVAGEAAWTVRENQ